MTVIPTPTTTFYLEDGHASAHHRNIDITTPRGSIDFTFHDATPYADRATVLAQFAAQFARESNRYLNLDAMQDLPVQRAGEERVS